MFVRRGLSRTRRCGSHGGWRRSFKSPGWHRSGLKLVQNRERLDQKHKQLNAGPGAVKFLQRADRDTATTSFSVSAAAPHPHLGFIRGAEAARERLVWDCHPSNRHAGQRTGALGLSGARARLVTCLDAPDDFTHRKTSDFVLHSSGICILYIDIVLIEFKK